MVKKHGGSSKSSATTKSNLEPKASELEDKNDEIFDTDDQEEKQGSKPEEQGDKTVVIEKETLESKDEQEEKTVDGGAIVFYPLKVDYCGICSMPIEYCQYSPTYEQCRRWLEKNLPDLFGQLFVAKATATSGRAEEILEAEKMAAEFIRDNLMDGAGVAKRQTRGGKGNSSKMAVAPKGKINPKASSVKVFTAPRGKKKAVTVVTGLQEFGVDLKAASKFFASKYSCGASVTGDDEIVVQGDVKDDMLDIISEKWPDIPDQCVKDLGIMKR